MEPAAYLLLPSEQDTAFTLFIKAYHLGKHAPTCDQRVTLLTLLAQSLHKEDLPPVRTKKRRFGRAKGKFVYPADFDEGNEEIARLFGAV